jgi:hypothetical protein
MQEALQQADVRLKAARAASRAAYTARRDRALREAERDADNVISMLDERHREREIRERLEGTGT